MHPLHNKYMNILDSSYYNQFSTLNLAKDLLGKYITYETSLGKLRGMIVETEAYLSNDPACHGYKGITKKNHSIFQEAGKAYVYLIYGIYYCFNVSSQEKGVGEAVLIRAVEPLIGINIMSYNRYGKKVGLTKKDIINLTNGPGKLSIAFSINKKDDGHKLWEKYLYLEDNPEYKPKDIITSKRIGINIGKDLEYRFYLKNNKFVSKV